MARYYVLRKTEGWNRMEVSLGLCSNKKEAERRASEQMSKNPMLVGGKVVYIPINHPENKKKG